VKSIFIRILKSQDVRTICESSAFSFVLYLRMRAEMPSRYTKVEYVIDITIGRIVRLKNYRVQHKRGAKSFGFHS
jgi:hypothetical protein